MRIAWLAPYPVQKLQPDLKLARTTAASHPCSWIVNLSNALAALPNVELHLLVESPLVEDSQTVQFGGITFHVLKGGMPFVNRGYPPWLPVDLLTRFHFEVRRLANCLREIDPDIVHAHGTEGPNALAAVKSRKPSLVSIQGIINEFAKTNPCFRFRMVCPLERRAVRQSKYFTCRTDFDTNFIARFNPAATVFNIHEAMNPVFFDNEWHPLDTNTLLFVGSLEKRKGIATLLEAVTMVKETHPNVFLRIAGTGPAEYLKQLRDLCQQRTIINNVSFLGFQTAAEIAKLHLESQIFVLPSENENSPNTVAEAMVTGMPVIATRVGGIPSMVRHNETGILVNPNAPRELADAIIDLLQNSAKRHRLGDAARQIARSRHLPSKVAEETVHAYETILRTEGQLPYA